MFKNGIRLTMCVSVSAETCATHCETCRRAEIGIVKCFSYGNGNILELAKKCCTRIFIFGMLTLSHIKAD